MYNCLLPEFHRLEPSVESLLESPNAELSLNSKLLSISIPQGQGETSGSKKNEPRYKLSKLLCIIAFYRSSTWLEPSVESLLVSPNVELSLNSKLLSSSKFLLKSTIAELSLDSELYLISIP